MKACIGTTAQVRNIVKQAEDAGLAVEKTRTTIKVFGAFEDGEPIYAALLKYAGSDSWIVRYDTDCFQPG